MAAPADKHVRSGQVNPSLTDPLGRTGDPILTIRVVRLLVEAWAQVNVTRVTVSDRQAPPEPARYGTQMARRP